jgi:hypothetical protein
MASIARVAEPNQGPGSRLPLPSIAAQAVWRAVSNCRNAALTSVVFSPAASALSSAAASPAVAASRDRAALERWAGSIWAAANTALVVPRSTAIREPASRTAEAAASLLLN